VNSDEPQEADVLAAEYVLGTLDGEERAQAEALIASDPGFAARVSRWERQLGELHALAGGVEPPPAVWDAIKAKLPETPQTAALRLPELPRPANVVDLTARIDRFRMLAGLYGAMAAMLALFIVTSVVAPTLLPDALRPRPRVIVQMAEGPPPPPRYVAVLQRDAAAPAFIVTVDIAARSLTVRRVTAEREPGKNYELWLVSNQFPAPRSLGLVGGGEFTQSANLAAYDPATISDASFAVSLEPEGGSPSGAPSNVMFAGKLVESFPPQPR
jgi:anti-sigma-K factor RskA